MLKKALIFAALLAVGVGAFLVLKDGRSGPEYVTAEITRGDVTDSASAAFWVSPSE